ncbi:unnamed protein product [Lota lota]
MAVSYYRHVTCNRFDKVNSSQTRSRGSMWAKGPACSTLRCKRALPPGASVLVIPPDAAFPCDLGGEAEALLRRELLLEDLRQAVLRFIYAYAPGADSYIAEE